MFSQILIACALCFAFLSQQVSGTAANGLPLLSTVSPYPIPVLSSLLYNAFEVRNMTANEQWCTFDEERKDWCGGNYSNPYLLCIVLDQPWPFASQNALEAYLNETDVAPATSIWPGINAICICDTGNPPTRFHAYVIPEDPVPVPRFQPECHAEAGLLFCYILLALLYCILGYWALLEVVMWILMFVVKEKPFNILGGFLPKIFILLMTILMVINIGMINGSASSTPQWQFAIFWTWVWIAMFLVSAYLWWLVVFADVVTKTKNMSRETSLFITVTKWLIVFFVCGLLIGFCIAMGLSYHYALEITTEPNFRIRAAIAPSYIAARKTNIVLGCIMIFIITVWGLGLTLYSAYLIVGNKNEGIKKTMREKTLWNTVACIFWWPVLFTLVVYAYYVSWHVIDLSQYQTQIAFMWIYMIEGAAAWFVLLSITVALRTNFSEDSGYCASICGNIQTLEETRTSSKGSSKGSKSRGITGGTIA